MNIKKVIDIYCQEDNKVKKVIDIKKAKVLYDRMVEHNDQKSLCDGVKQKTVKELFDYFVFNNQGSSIDYQVVDDETGEVQNVYENIDDVIETLQNVENLSRDEGTIQAESKKANVEGEKVADATLTEKAETKEKITEKTNE